MGLLVSHGLGFPQGTSCFPVPVGGGMVPDCHVHLKQQFRVLGFSWVPEWDV